MKFQQLIEEIQKAKRKLEEELLIQDEEYDFLEHFVTNNFFTRIEDIIKIDSHELLLAYLTSGKNQLTFSEIREYSEENQNLFIEMELKKALKALKIVEKYTKIKEEMTKFKHLPKMTSNCIENMVNASFSSENTDIQTLSKLYRDNPYSFEDIIVLIREIEWIEDKYEKIIKVIRGTEEEIGGKLTKRETNNTVEKEFSKDDVLQHVRESLKEIQAYYEKIRDEKLSRERKIKKQLFNYKKLEEIFHKNSLGIPDIEQIFSSIEDKNLRVKVLKCIDSYNRQEYQDLMREYEELSKKEVVQYQYILKEYDISYDGLSKEEQDLLKKYRVEELSTILSSLKTMELEQDIIYILKYSTKEIVLSITEYIKEGILLLPFVRENKTIFVEDRKVNGNYYQFLENMEMIQGLDLNIRIFNKDQSILLMNSRLLEKNLKVLEEYNALSWLKRMEQYVCLKDFRLEEKIDVWLELGFEEQLEEYPDILNRNIEKIRRIRLLKDLNFPVESIEVLLEMLDTNKFIIEDENLNQYILNVVPFRIPEYIEDTMKLEKGEEENSNQRIVNTPRTYKLANVVFSRNRVDKNKRKLEQLELSIEDKEFYALVYGSILNEEEWDTIHKKIYQEKSLTISTKNV